VATKPVLTLHSRGWHNSLVMTAKQGARIAKAKGGQAESKLSDYKPGTSGQQEFYSTYKQLAEREYEKELRAIQEGNDYGV